MYLHSHYIQQSVFTECTRSAWHVALQLQHHIRYGSTWYMSCLQSLGLSVIYGEVLVLRKSLYFLGDIYRRGGGQRKQAKRPTTGRIPKRQLTPSSQCASSNALIRTRARAAVAQKTGGRPTRKQLWTKRFCHNAVIHKQLWEPRRLNVRPHTAVQYILRSSSTSFKLRQLYWRHPALNFDVTTITV